MRAPHISQFGLADPAPAGQLIPAPAAARTAAGQSMSGLTVLSTYLKPRALAADNAWPLRMLGHWLGFSFLKTPSSSLKTPSSSTQANMWRGRMP